MASPDTAADADVAGDPPRDPDVVNNNNDEERAIKVIAFSEIRYSIESFYAIVQPGTFSFDK
jgi:hypothetical protein